MKALWLTAVTFLFAASAHAVDKDDIYLSGYFGLRLDQKYQGGFEVGYAPINEFGGGIAIDQTAFSSQGLAEVKWFLEPLEFSGGAGFATMNSGESMGQSFTAFMLGLGYLWAITPSLAFKAEARAQFLLHSTSSVLLSLGARIVF